MALDMVGVAQSVERRIVAPEVVGSIPIVHPMSVPIIPLSKKEWFAPAGGYHKFDR